MITVERGFSPCKLIISTEQDRNDLHDILGYASQFFYEKERSWVGGRLTKEEKEIIQAISQLRSKL